MSFKHEYSVIPSLNALFPVMSDDRGRLRKQGGPKVGFKSYITCLRGFLKHGCNQAVMLRGRTFCSGIQVCNC